MRGVVFNGERELALMQFPDPTPDPHDVVIEMKASGMCGSDLHQYRRPERWRAGERHPDAGGSRDRRARALRRRGGDRFRRRCAGGACRPAGDGAPLSGLHPVQPLPLRMAAALPGGAGQGLRQQRPWRPRAISEGAGQYAGAAAGRVVVLGRCGDRLRFRHRLRRAAAHEPLRQRHHRDLRPGPGGAGGHAICQGDGRAGDRARHQPAAAGARRGVRRRSCGQPRLERSGGRDQGPHPWPLRRPHARHFEQPGCAA